MSCECGVTHEALELPPLAVDAKTLSKMLGLSVRTIRSMNTRGKLPKPVRLSGHSIRWIVSEVEAWLEAGCPDRDAWESIRDDKRRARK